MTLGDEQVARVSELVAAGGVTSTELHDNLVDHICCAIEEKLEEGMDFDAALELALNEVAPGGLAAVEELNAFWNQSTYHMNLRKIAFFIGLLGAMTTSLGWTFTVLHWPGARELSTYGLLLLFAVFLPLLVLVQFPYFMRFSRLEKLRTFFGFASGLLLGVSFGMKSLHLSGADIAFVSGALLFTFGFLPAWFFRMYRRNVAPNP